MQAALSIAFRPRRTQLSTDAFANSFQFPVEKVKLATKKQPAEPIRGAIQSFVQGEIESTSVPEGDTAELLSHIHYHPLLAAVYISYSLHYPLVLSPDAVWITICQGIAHHMVIDGEKLREKFVSHKSGQVTLSHVATSAEIDVDAVSESWCAGIRKHVGDEMADLLSCNFSTTTKVDRTVGHVTMMDVFRRYFKYQMVCICGLPSVTLEGTVEDWELLRLKAVDALNTFEMDWWLTDLEPILNQFVQARSGHVDLPHWKNICKLEDAYGGHIINGWIGKLFPYLRSFVNGPCHRRNRAIGAKGKVAKEGFQTMVAPSGLSKVPFDVVDALSGHSLRKEVVAGFLGVTQDRDTLALRPMTGWAIRKAPKADLLIHRLMHEKSVSYVEIPMEERNLCDENAWKTEDERFPQDLDRIYHEVKAVQIGPNEKSIRIVPKENVQALGEEEKSGDEEDSFRYPPEGPLWSRIAELDDSRCVVADLQKHYRDPKIIPGDFSSWRKADPNFCVICVCNKTDGKTEELEGPVVAYSVCEWLEKALDWAATPQQDCPYYWDAPGFEPVGDIQNPTNDATSKKQKIAKSGQ